MTKKQRSELIQRIKEALKAKGFTENRWGHWTAMRTSPRTGRTYPVRFVFKKTALREESKLPSGAWIRLRSAYYKDLSVKDGVIYGLQFFRRR